jgi:hypothetical protein
LAAGRKLRDALGVTATDVSWSAFASDAPELARTVQDVLERHRFAFAGTVRRDGSPRINPVEVHVSDGRLFVVLIPARLKRMIWIAIRASPSKHRLQARALPVWR